MREFTRFFRKSITRRFVAMMLVFCLLLLAGAITLLQNSSSALRDFQTVTGQLEKKREIVTNLVAHSTQIVLRLRGYYAYQNKQEYEAAFVEKKQLEDTIAQFKQLPLDGVEVNLIHSIEAFFNDIFTNVLPQATRFVESNDYESLRKLSSGGLTNAFNDLLVYGDRYQSNTELELKKQNNMLVDRLYEMGMWLLIYFVFLLLVAIGVTSKTARDIGRPLGQLSVEAGRFALGKSVDLHHLNREDEIGQLSKSMDYMMVQIQSKEEELLAQNEELLAQQDELQTQQDELQEALHKMKGHERYLEKRNLLIQALTSTNDRHELLHGIIRHTVELMDAEKGIIVLLNESRDYASFGVSEQGVAQLLNEMEHGMFVRIMETKQPRLVIRQETAAEKGYHLDAMKAYDLYLPVLNADNKVSACLVLTRLGKELSALEQAEAAGLAGQVALSLEKLAMHEETEKQRRLTHDMLDTIQEGVQTLHLDGTIMQVNRTMCEMLGYEDANSMNGMPMETFFGLLRQKVVRSEQLAKFIGDILSGKETASNGYVYEMTEPVKRYVQMYFEPLYQKNERIGTLLVHRDITKEYEVDRMKSEFVSTVSHELRTPLASVLGFTELLLNKELKPERQRKYLTTIHTEAKRLTSLINDFLDLQRMESGRQSYDKKTIEIGSLLEQVISQYPMDPAMHRVVLERAADRSVVIGDKDKLQQVFLNLLSNAVKYSPSGGTVTITYKEEGPDLVIEVKDEGLGIPDDALPQLFNKFYRVDNSDRREIGGTGLGLAIVKEIVQEHSGTISAASVYGKGSVFTVRLPQSDETVPEVGPAVPNESIALNEVRKRKVMLIEDDSNLSELLQEQLLECGYEVYTHADGDRAVDAMRSILPDAVVLDLVLENGGDGWKVIERMKRDEQLRSIPIVISSAFEEKEKASEWGAKGYLIKPYFPGLLTKALDQAIERKKREGEILIPEKKE
ncbi:ATP-binding protein [Paenibacillus thalictri]|uniref:histidine kinase n=1 Tax=Paenibacillus thalictri TaxID=2527873 RepID=A0A4Q9DKE8_9BACL|nr:ATP-binding protein [Paenibacillus thalictri]TBL74506.1 response regulator [Paenibacillus thalictri]